MTSREIIRRVLGREEPPRIGLTFGPHQGRERVNDVVVCGPAPAEGGAWRNTHDGFEVRTDEWGCRWRRVRGREETGEPVRAPIEYWDDLADYTFPNLDDPTRYTACGEQRRAADDKYLLGRLHGCALNHGRYLRLFDQYLFDCVAEPDRVRALNEQLCDLAVAQAAIYADLGCDGVVFYEDWGNEERLHVRPEMWVELFKPDFERLINAAHEHGLTVWMHTAGAVQPILPHLAELGLDVLRHDEPELLGFDALARHPLTYWCPVDVQRTLPTGNRRLIEQRARQMVGKLGGQGGGFIAREPVPAEALGIQPEWEQWAYEVFEAEGRYGQSTG